MIKIFQNVMADGDEAFEAHDDLDCTATKIIQSMQTLFMIEPGQVVGYLDLNLGSLYDQDYLEF